MYFNMLPGDCLLLKKPLYLIFDAGGYWSNTFGGHVKKILKLTALLGDLSFYIKEGKNDTDGLIWTYVDDLIFAGNEFFLKLPPVTKESSKANPLVRDSFEFFCVIIESKKCSWGTLIFNINQGDCFEPLMTVPH